MNKGKGNLGVVLLALLVLVILAVLITPDSAASDLKYSEMLSYFRHGEVKEFSLDLGTGELEMKLDGKKDDVTYKMGSLNLFVNDVQPYIEQYNEKHPDAPMVYDYVPAKENSVLLTILTTFVPLILMMVFFVFIMNQAGGGGRIMNVGKAKTKETPNERDRKTFEDVAGADEEKAELQEIVDFLKNPAKYTELGAKIPHGVLLQGPPGTGKTLLAKACAGEANVPFYAMSGSEFMEMYVGVGASRVRDLFEKAKKTAPSVVFIDEIDAVGGQRGAGIGGGYDERAQTLNQLLVEMDGFGASESVIVIAATNRSDILDQALLRPGRFDRQIYVGTPDVIGREAILKVHARNKRMAPDVDLAAVARATTGFTGADLANLLNEAALLAVKKGKKAVCAQDIQDSVTKVLMGVEKKSNRFTEADKKLTAYHEAGHAVLGYYLQPDQPVREVSIIPRGLGAGGYTMYLPKEDMVYTTKRQMENELCVSLGGRMAEKLVLEDISTGASGDLKHATSVARAMVMKYGFSEKLGLVVYGTDPSTPFLGRDFSQGRGYSEDVAGRIDAEVQDILDVAFERARVCLEEHIDDLHRLAAELLQKEKISGEEFARIMKKEQPESIADVSEKQPSDENTEQNAAENVSVEADFVAEQRAAEQQADFTEKEKESENGGSDGSEE